jgi:thiol-disulfide isomerase/thioredoxin
MKLIKFYRENCSPCRAVDKILKELGQDFYPVNVEESPDLVKEFNITTVPTLVKINHDGITTKEGFSSREDLIEWLQQ